MVKRDKSERKLIPDTKSIASKKRSEEFLVQEVKTTMRNLQSTLAQDWCQAFKQWMMKLKKGKAVY